MAGVGANPTVASGEQEALDILKEIEALAEQTGDRRVDRRIHKRQLARIDCRIRFLAPDGATVLTTSGKTRGISRTGLGLVAREHFLQEASLLVTLNLCDGETKDLTGTVVYSRRVREGWYLTGMRFGKIDDPKLIQETSEGTATETRPSAGSLGQRAGNHRPENRDRRTSPRERALQMLTSPTFTRRLTNAKISKVVALSMSSDHAVRRATIPVLMQAATTDATEMLIRLLDDPNAVIQGEAAEALGELHASAAIEGLKNLLQQDDERVALCAALSLAKMEDKSGLRVASRVVLSKSPLNRRAALVLGLIVGRDFRPNSDGLAAARKYLSANKTGSR